jgi:hypothetical protein
MQFFEKQILFLYLASCHCKFHCCVVDAGKSDSDRAKITFFKGFKKSFFKKNARKSRGILKFRRRKSEHFVKNHVTFHEFRANCIVVKKAVRMQEKVSWQS